MPWGNWTRPFIIIVAEALCEQSKEICKTAASEQERSLKIIQDSLAAVQKAKEVLRTEGVV